MVRRSWLVPAVLLSVSMAAQAQGNGRRAALDPDGVARLVADSGGAQVSVHGATGAAKFVRAAPGGRLGLQRSVVARAISDDAKNRRSAEFLTDYAGAFGITSVAAELGEARITKDRHGGTHLAYKQFYRGVPVFAGELKAHFDAADELIAVNGTFVPGIALDASPTRSAEQAGKVALAKVQADNAAATGLSASKATLLVYRAGLAQGIAGANHLAWRIEVGNGVDVREFVFVDAHSGKYIDQITGIHDGKFRRAYDGAGATAPGPNYPASPFWVEGQAYPSGNLEADQMIVASGEIYDLFKNAFGRDSFDSAGAVMDSIFNRGNGCPNASWNGVFISFCPGTTTDDIIAHEWGHAYTEFTSNLIYAWQPGALNESYSDIWGETVDRINARGIDVPNTPRSADACTVYTPKLPTVTINAPASIAGVKDAGTATFGPQAFDLTGDVVVVNDGAGAATTDGCETPFVNAAAVAGKIAFIDRGTCGFAIKAKNAQLNGAVAVMIGNNSGGTSVINMSGTDATITIPTLSVSQNDGTAIKAQTTTVNASLSRGGGGTDNSVAWLMGEEASAFNGAIRDMYNPTCYNNPGKVSDRQYVCGTGDAGGVHSNSGVPNHAFALMVDGGTYNGQSIAAIGLTKAAHIHYRAQSVYLGEASDFVDHADAVEQSCADLTGKNLADLLTGAPSGQSIGAADCAQVANALVAVEMRTPPTQCNFQPLLAKNPPPLCEGTTNVRTLFRNSFELGQASINRWTVSHTAVTADFTPRDWVVAGSLPGEQPGRALFGVDFRGGTCAPGGDESGVMHIDSPEITIPASVDAPRLAFDHWVATEAGADGGNLKISVNGGPWTLVKGADFIYNPYNSTLATAAQGNTNPMAGEAAFTGSDGGSVEGSWGRSIVNLAPYAKAKDKIRLRFDIGNDGCGGAFGWYVDDLSVYSCRP